MFSIHILKSIFCPPARFKVILTEYSGRTQQILKRKLKKTNFFFFNIYKESLASILSMVPGSSGKDVGGCNNYLG